VAEGRRRGVKKSRSGTLVLDEPVSPPELEVGGHASLVLIHPPEQGIGRRLELDGQSYRVGRDATCDLPLEIDAVSRLHAELRRDASRGGWRVRDLGSTNGTFVNEREISEASLRDGDQVRFGDVVFKFLSGASIEHQYHDELYQLSVLDGLTGAHNRRYFLDSLERELASARRHQHPLTLVMFDLDHFKTINDERGHLAGDAVLKELAERIKPRIRREDLFARYGGEEFAAILTITAMEGGVRFAEALRGLVARRPFSIDGGDRVVTISAGVATTLDEAELDAAGLIRRADEALYEAKRQGRNRVVASGPPRRAGA
jgi:two-component system, cell cycle response regulator